MAPEKQKIIPDILFPTPVISIKFPDCGKVNEGLIKLARQMQEQDGKVGANHNHSGKNTWQSMRFIHTVDNPAVKEWRESVEKLFKDWAESILEEKDFELVLDSSWFNINPPGGENKPHTHPGANWSGVYYGDKPQKSGNIQLYDPIVQRHPLREPKNKTRKTSISVESETGGLVMFPAWLQHSVEVNTCKEDRISISFTTIWKYTGGKQNDVNTNSGYTYG